jgi:hypothetical protein
MVQGGSQVGFAGSVRAGRAREAGEGLGLVPEIACLGTRADGAVAGGAISEDGAEMGGADGAAVGGSTRS